MKRFDKRKRIYATASAMSVQTWKPWYICKKPGFDDVSVSEENLKRYMQLGFKVECVFYEGKRYKNLYMLDGKLQFVM